MHADAQNFWEIARVHGALRAHGEKHGRKRVVARLIRVVGLLARAAAKRG